MKIVPCSLPGPNNHPLPFRLKHCELRTLGLLSRPVGFCCAMPISNLTKHLMWAFGTGDISAARLQRMAASAVSDGVYETDELLKSIARAGDGGAISGHVHRDTMRACKRAGLLNSSAQPYIAQLRGDAGTIHMFLPHEVYADLAKEVGERNLLLRPEEWAGQHGLGNLLRQWGSHPDVDITEGLREVGIVGLHCDAVPYTKTKSILAASLNVVSAPSDRVRSRRQPLFLLRKARLCNCGCQGFCTMQDLFGVIAWSMSFLKSGVWPTCRHDGTPWSAHDRKTRMTAGALPRAALLQIRGDWEFFTQMLRFRSINSDQFCWLCQATKSPGDRCFKCMDPTAGHRLTLITNESYFQACIQEAAEPSALFRSPGTGLHHVAIDSMHAGDLGAFQDALGSLLWIELNNKQWPGARPEKITRLNRELAQYYAANDVRGLTKIGDITYGMVFSKTLQYPYLKAKAAQTRHLAEFGLALAYRHLRGSPDHVPFEFGTGHRLHGRHGEHLQQLVGLFEGMVGFHRACAAPLFDPAACKTAMYRFLQNAASLHNMWREELSERDQSVQPFHLRMKHHILQHLAEEQTLLWGSPSRAWCYRDEDFVGAVKQVATKSHHPATVEKLVSEKMMLLSALGAHL